MARPSKVPGKADNWQICLFCGKAPRFFHRFLSFFHLEWHLGGGKFQGKPEILFQKYVLVWPNSRKCQGRQIIGKSVFFFAEMRCRFDVIFWTRIAPRRLKISQNTRNSILKIVFTMVGHPKMPREVRNGRFLPIAPIWPVAEPF